MGVQIQGDTGNVIATKGTFSGDVGIGGTLTYEDVTNVDSLGIITARNGIEVGASPGVGASISVDGNAEFAGIVTASQFVGSGANLTGVASTENIRTNTNATFLQNINVSGTVTATSYAGDGSSLTGIAVGVATTVATGISGITTVLDLSNVDHKITVSGITTIDVRGGTEGDTHSVRIINSGITTVGFSTYFLFPSGGTPNLPTADGSLSMISFTVHRQGVVGLATQLFAGASVNFS